MQAIPLRATCAAAILLAAAGLMSCREMRPLAVGSGQAAWTFETDPLASGWTTEGPYQSGSSHFIGQWSPTGGVSESGCLSVRKGLWQTPPLAVQPLQYYRARFATRTDRMSFYAFRFYDKTGRIITADEHTAIDPTAQWDLHDVYTQARENAATMRLAFLPGDGEMTSASELWIDNVTVSPGSPRKVLAANDRLYRTLPPVTWTPPAARWTYLGNTRKKLETRQELRVVLLGDSIANDMGNSQFHLMIQRQHPGSKVVLLRSIKGGTGCDFYKDHVQEFVVDKSPDLVIIAGISHRFSTNAIGSVIEQTRRLAGRPVDFLVLTGAIIEPGMDMSYKNRGMDSPPPEVHLQFLEKEKVFYTQLSTLSETMEFATLDMRTVWEDYLAGSGQPRAWYQRDFVHANNRGKQILGRIMEQFFAPE